MTRPRIDARVLVNTPDLWGNDCLLFFGTDVEIFVMPPSSDMFDILVAVGAYGSKSAARQAKICNSTIPDGYSILEFGRLHNVIQILKPVGSIADDIAWAKSRGLDG